MLNRLLAAAGLAAFLTTSALAQGSDTRFDIPLAAEAATCDRACLLQILGSYVDVVTGAPVSGLPLAPTVRATENGTELTLGDNSAWSDGHYFRYRQSMVDPVTGSALFMGVLTNRVTPHRFESAEVHAAAAARPKREWFYVVRLKVENQQITEVEEITYEPDGTQPVPVVPDRLVAPDRLWDSIVPESQRVSRQQLFAIVNQYYDVVGKKIPASDIRWHPDCMREENGSVTVNSPIAPESCLLSFDNPWFWTVGNRRFYIADEERQVVFAAGTFLHPEFNSSTGLEIFKVEDGLLKRIEAFYRRPSPVSGWGDDSRP